VKAKGLVCLIVSAVFLFVGLMLGTCAPISLKLAAPVACPDGYMSSVVVVEVSNPEPGTTTMDPDLYCMDPSGVPVRANWLVAVLTLALECGLQNAT
jgi:hypothetical protein